MKHLLIIGARGWGREAYALAQQSIGYLEEFDIRGFLDDDSNALDGKPDYPPIIDSVEHYEPQPDDVFICALGDAHWRRHYAEIILNKGGEFINLIHKKAFIGKNTSIGIGCIIDSDVSISCDIKVGNFVTFQRLSDIGHDCVIDDFAHLGCKSFMGGYAHLGEESTIQTSAIILPHVTVGKNCIVGAGAVAIRKVKDGQTVYGNPAKVLKCY